MSVVLGCASTADRFDSAATLLDYGFANWSMVTPELPELPDVPVEKGMQDSVQAEAVSGGSLLVSKGKEAEITSEVKMSESLTAPVEKGQKIGKIIYKLGDETLQEIDVRAKDAVSEITFFSAFKVLLKSLLCY